MERRNFIAGFAAMEFLMNADDSVYIPDHHKITDPEVVAHFMSEFAFADLITASPGIRATHIPVVYESGTGKYGRIVGHVAKANPQQALFDGSHEALIVFHGPHAYISPSWYEAGKPAVPTWNFAAVHAGGKLRAINDDVAKEKILEHLVNKFESYESAPWSLAKLPESYKKGLRQGIVAFEMEIATLEAKFKLGLERSATDRQGMLKGLKSAKPERSLLEFTEAEINRRASRA